MNPNLINLMEEWEQGQLAGKCKGSRDAYKPWFGIGQCHSWTPRHRVFCGRLNRLIHLMSYSELVVFHRLEWMDNVRDIKEQIALDPNLTIDISEKLGYKHPGYTFGGKVMTSDFLVYLIDNLGNEFKIAIQVKKTKELSKRDLEKIAIEREYWRLKGVDFELICLCDLNQILTENLHYLYRLRQLPVSTDDIHVLHSIGEHLINSKPSSLFAYLSNEKSITMPSGAVYSLKEVIQMLCAKKVFIFPLRTKIITDCMLREFVEN